MRCSTSQQVGLQPVFVPSHRIFRSGAAPLRPCRQACVVQALPDTTSLAVSQQGLIFAATLVAEGLYTRSQLAEDTPGRPSLLPIIASTLGIVAAVGLVNLGEQGQQLGLLVGGSTSAVMLALSLKRTVDTRGDDREFPGPKAWPIFISTGAFFAMLAFFQAIQYLG